MAQIYPRCRIEGIKAARLVWVDLQSKAKKYEHIQLFAGASCQKTLRSKLRGQRNSSFLAYTHCVFLNCGISPSSGIRSDGTVARRK